MQVLGIDIGGSGIKGAPVDTTSGQLLSEKVRLRTPPSAKPGPMIDIVAKIAKDFSWDGPIGCGFPGVIRDGKTLTAANVSNKWIGYNAAGEISARTGCPVSVINDADAAGLAEMALGAGCGRKGTVLVVTIGTGIGTALFSDGYLLPNMELGHIEIDGEDAEKNTSDAARRREDLSWEKWGKRFNRYLNTLQRLVWPELIIIGGGGSSKYDRYSQFLDVPVEIQTAKMLNEAGIVGSALAGLTDHRFLHQTL
jgi:polyphosphate glucokinase